MYSCVVGSKHRRVSRERPCTSRSSRQKREADCLVVVVHAEARPLRAGGLIAVLVLDGTDAVDKEVLGGKAFSLVRMLRLSINVPPAFCITTEECSRYHEAGGRIPRRCSTRCPGAMVHLEEVTGRTFGDPDNGLLLPVRSGAPSSMPGMMDTVLNLGVTEGGPYLSDVSDRSREMY